jgi:hypothetical protein
MKRRRVSAVLGMGLVIAVGVTAGAGEVGAPTPASGPSMRAYVDPATGKLLKKPPPGARVPPATAESSRSSQGLVEEPVPGGGVKVDLQGRFRSPLVATVRPDGSVGVRHGASDGTSEPR